MVVHGQIAGWHRALMFLGVMQISELAQRIAARLVSEWAALSVSMGVFMFGAFLLECDRYRGKHHV